MQLSSDGRVRASVALLLLAGGCLRFNQVWQETIPLRGSMDPERRAALAREFVSRDRYARMCAAAQERYGLTNEQARSLSLHWRRSGHLGGESEVVIIVGMAYRHQIGNTREVVRFCRGFIEAELPVALGGSQASKGP